jgi:DNA gyrase/topoisomerase IV subunit A
MNKRVNSGAAAMEKILEGVNLVANPVISTLSPKGRTVVISKSAVIDYGIRNFPLEVTKDGYRVAMNIASPDPEIQVGVLFAQQAIEKQMTDVGDATTTCALMVKYLLEAGLKEIENGKSHVAVKTSILNGVEYVISELKKMSTEIAGNAELVRQVATVSANGDEKIGDLIAEAFEKIETSIFSNTHDTLYCFTNTGTVHQIKVYSLPEGNRGDKGQHISKFLTIDPNETIVSYLSLSECADDDYLVFANSSGVVKRTLASYYTDLYNGCIAIKLKDKDNLVSVLKCKEHDDVFLATEEGLSIRFCAEDISVTNRNTQGCWGINLSDTDRVIGAVAIPTVKNKHGKYDTKDDKSAILTVTSLGFGKRTLVDDYLKPKDVFGHAERQSRGGKGKINIKLTPKIGKVVKVILLGAEDEVLVSTSDGKNARVSADEIRTVGRNSSGVSLVKIKDKDTVVGACRIPCSV